MKTDSLGEYYEDVQAWATDYEADLLASRKTAWVVAAAAATIALLEAIALIILLPLKTVVPYTLLVDSSTGIVQTLDPSQDRTISPNEAMEQSLLAQYVVARESFDIDTLRDSYRKVALWSAGDARSRYLSEVQASNPSSPLATLPRRALVNVDIRSILPIDANTAMVRYLATRTDPGGQTLRSEPMVAYISYRFSDDAMSTEDRLVNPLGFQVVRYRRSAEMGPEVPGDAVRPQPMGLEQPSSVRFPPLNEQSPLQADEVAP